MKKICVVTGTRAEYGLLRPIIKQIEEHEELQLVLAVTGAHLSAEFGYTYREIEEDGFQINAKIDMLSDGDETSDLVKAMGIELIGFSEFFESTKVDMLIVLGDRYEILIAATAATMFRIPIAHIHGGEITEGAIDDVIRHAITKLSYLHFTSTEEYRQRVIQLGENPNRVFNVGALGVENIHNLSLLSKLELEKELNFCMDGKVVLVTFHPETMGNRTAEEQFSELLTVLAMHEEFRLIFTKANADAHGRRINRLIDGFVASHSNRSISFHSLGQLRYLSTVKYCAFVIGNSSSGILEVPSLGIPTIDIGERQKGRIAAESVIHCDISVGTIEGAIQQALGNREKKFTNPYEQKDTAKEIINHVVDVLTSDCNFVKQFYDIE